MNKWLISIPLVLIGCQSTEEQAQEYADNYCSCIEEKGSAEACKEELQEGIDAFQFDEEAMRLLLEKTADCFFGEPITTGPSNNR